MKTVFKKGMKVYDQVNFPDKEGKVLDIKEDAFSHKIHSYDYPIEVQFEGKDDLSYYDLEGCPVWSSNPTLSTSPYTLQGFEQKAPTPTFEEALDWLKNNKDYRTVYRDNRIYPSNEIYVAFEALRKLVILRDYYNEGWQPDWNNLNKKKYVIYSEKEMFVIREFTIMSCVLAFESSKIALKFLEEQRELLKIAKPLL